MSVDSFTYMPKPIVGCEIEARGRLFLTEKDAQAMVDIYRTQLIRRRKYNGPNSHLDISGEVVTISPSENQQTGGYAVLLRTTKPKAQQAPRWNWQNYLSFGASFIAFAAGIALITSRRPVINRHY